MKQREGELEETIHRCMGEEGNEISVLERELMIRDRVISDLKGDIDNLKSIINQ